MTTQRFSKKLMTEKLTAKVQYLKQEHGFTNQDGWNQVRNKPIEVVVAYGQWAAYNDLLVELSW